MSDVMNSKARPMHCKIVDETSDVFLTSSTYPTLETNKEECTSQMEKVDLVWDYKKNPTGTDFMCFYADGLFLKRVKGTDNSADNIKTLVDERPSSGTGPKSMQLINHFMQTAVDQRLNADVTPLGHELTAQAFEVVR